MQKQAMYYERTDDGAQCLLCPHGCLLRLGETGLCNARRNVGGELVSLNYGKTTALALDPICKKPLKQFFPGSYILSYGSFGCNLRCRYCQNWRISQESPEAKDMTPQEVVDIALQRVSEGNIGVAYTYNEPLVGYEFVYDCAGLVHEAGLKNVLVTNGYIRMEPLMQLLPFIDAMNIDLKGSSDFYEDVCGGQQAVVKQTLLLSSKLCHVEVTMLIIPGYNDSEADVEAVASWLADLSREIPLHLTRYHPDYHMHERATEASRVLALADVARVHLHNVYCGNM